MNTFKKIAAVMLAVMMIVSVAAISATATQVDVAETSADGITIHVESEDCVPYVYYWNALPQDLETAYPGVKMTKDTALTGGNWYTYSFPNTEKINLLFTDGTDTLDGQISTETSRTTGEWFYIDGKWKSRNPYDGFDYEFSDMREDTIYFVITTRFYDGDTGNNIPVGMTSKLTTLTPTQLGEATSRVLLKSSITSRL